MRNPDQYVRDPAIRSRVPHDQLALDNLLHGHCRYCGSEIVFVPTVGWVVPHSADESDSCARARLGRHKPVVQPTTW